MALMEKLVQVGFGPLLSKLSDDELYFVQDYYSRLTRPQQSQVMELFRAYAREGRPRKALGLLRKLLVRRLAGALPPIDRPFEP